MIDYTQHINDYLSGKLSPDKRVELEAMLAIDKDLQEEFQIISSSRDYLKARAMLEEMENDPTLEEAERLVQQHLTGGLEDPNQSKDQIETEGQNVTEDQSLTQVGAEYSNDRWFFTILAIAAFLAGAFFVIGSITKIDSSGDIYHRYYNPISQEVFDRETVRGITSSFFYLGKQCYLNEDYRCALTNFRKIPDGSYYQGLAYLGLEEFENSAMSLLNYLSKYSEHPDANWYLGLCYLGLNDLESSKQYLDKLTHLANVHQEDALKIIDKIEKLQTAGRN